MDIEEKSTFKIEKLNGDNYFSWKFRMRNYLKKKGYWKAVAEEENNAMANEKALIDICLSVDDNQIVYVESCTTGTEAWQSLAEVYENKGMANKMDTEERFTSKRLHEGESAKQHIEELKRLKTKLKQLGVEKTKEEYIMRLLRSLPKSYESLVVTLENIAEKLSIEEIHARVLREESRQKMSEDQEKSGSLLQGKANYQKPRFPFNCHYCGKKGHKIADCRKRKKDLKNSSQSSSSNTTSGNFLMAEKEQKNINGTWYMDSGASFHMTNNRKWFVEETLRRTEPVTIRLGDGTHVKSTEKGNILMEISMNGSMKTLPVQDVLFVPEIATNILSIGQIDERGHRVYFQKGWCTVLSKYSNEKLLLVKKENSTYCFKSSKKIEENYAAYSATITEQELWHARLGHAGKSVLSQIISKKTADGVPKQLEQKDISTCKGCVLGKMSSKSFPSIGKFQSKTKLELIHTDLCGPMSIKSKGGKLYFITFTDDYTRKSFVYFLRNKNEALAKTRDFLTMVEKQEGISVKRIRSDRGGEYFSKTFENYFKMKGIIHEGTGAHQPQQNGVAERINRTLCEKARCMLYFQDLPRSFWAEAIQTANVIRNFVPTKILGDCSPHEKWFGKKPNISHLKVFGCKAYVFIPSDNRKKWDAKSRLCTFLGYEGRNYRFMDDTTRRVVVSGTAKFLEAPKIVPMEEEISLESETPDKNQVLSNSVEDNNSEHSEAYNTASENEEISDFIPRRSGRARKQPSWLTYEHADENEDTAAGAVMMLADEAEPKTVQEALSGAQKRYWKSAMEREINSLYENDTWTLIPREPEMHVLQPKWVFRIKPETKNQEKIFKARLVCKGYQQQHGIDYFETYAPVVRMASLRVMLAVALQQKMFINQMDVKTAFLNGRLEEEIFMEQPEGFVDYKNPSHVCKLQKSIYGLKQAPRAWYKVISKVLSDMSFKKSVADNGIFIGNYQGHKIYLAMYVDDIVMASTSITAVENVKAKLNSEFDMKDLGALRHILGIEIEYDREKGLMKLSQRKYAETVLKKFNMTFCKGVGTPLEANVILRNPGEEHTVENIPYREFVGSVMYLMLGTRPDLAFAIGLLSQFSERHSSDHWKACKRVLRYIQNTKNHFLLYQTNENSTLRIYSDASWGNTQFRKSISGFASFYGNCLVSWSSRKQNCVALSTTEAELIALTEAVKEGQWLSKLLTDLISTNMKPFKVYVDNQSTIMLSKMEGGHGKSKHISIRYFYVQDCVDQNEVKIEYCPTDSMTADILTKALPRIKHWTFMEHLGLQKLSS